MDEDEFERLLELFPVVRPRDYHVDFDSSTSRSGCSEELNDASDHLDRRSKGIDLHDAFWDKLKLVAEKKVGVAEAEKFCRIFQQIHQKVVYNELSTDAAWKFLNSSRC